MSYNVKKYSISTVFLVLAILFFALLGWRPQIMPSLFGRVIPLNALMPLKFIITPMPFIVVMFCIAYLAFKHNKAVTYTMEERKRLLLQFFLIGSSYFAWSIALDILLTDLIKTSAREEIKQFIAKPVENYEISVKGVYAKHPSKIIEEINKVTALPTHHSHATDLFPIIIKDLENNNSITLEIGQDSMWKNEYWIFNKNYWYTSHNEVGRIKSDFFKLYFRDK